MSYFLRCLALEEQCFLEELMVPIGKRHGFESHTSNIHVEFFHRTQESTKYKVYYTDGKKTLKNFKR